MERPNWMMALLAYLVPMVGSLVVIFTSRKNLFALYHACQALALFLIALAAPAVWVLFALAVTWIPIAGPVLSAASFALVIAAFIVLAIAWVVGVANSVRERLEPVPVFGDWGVQLLQRFVTTSPSQPS